MNIKIPSLLKMVNTASWKDLTLAFAAPFIPGLSGKPAIPLTDYNIDPLYGRVI
jgi:hypothetical protein